MNLVDWQDYSRWKLAQHLQTDPELGATTQQQHFLLAWQRQQRLETAIVAAARSRGLQPTDQALEHTRQQLADELQQLALTPQQIEAVICHQTLLREQLDWVSQQAPAPDEQQVMRWYHQHQAAFIRPEQRYSRHLLITAETHLPGSDRQIKLLARRLRSGRAQFAALAQRYSHCPTALEGGLMGWVGRGILYPQLESVLFQLEAGELSAVTATELGWHLLLCEQIRLPQPLPAEQALQQVRQQLQAQRQQHYQRQWLQQLLAGH